MKPGLYIVEPGKGQCKITEWYPGFEPRSLPEPILSPEFFVKRMKGARKKSTKPDIIGPNGFTEEFKLSALNDYDSLKKIIWSGDTEKLKLIKSNSTLLTRPSDEELGPLDYAIIGRKPEMIEKLIGLGADYNAKNKLGFTPVHTAAFMGAVDDLWILFKYGAKADNELEEPRLTSHPSDKELLQAIKLGSRLTPLHAAACSGDLDKVKALLERGAKVNVSGELGWTPLHIAAIMGKTAIYHAILDKGSNQSAIDYFERTPLGYIDDPEARKKYDFEVYSNEWGRKYFGR